MAGGGDELFVVPRLPGPLRPLSRAPRPEDDLDAAIDDLFGESTTERPGPFDLALLAIGVGLFVWAIVAHPDGIVLVGGIATLVLGSVLPLRSLGRVMRARRAQRKRRRAQQRAYVIDASAPATTGLVHAYQALFDAADQPGVLLADDARSAAHGAVVECASLLDGAPPSADAQVDYINKRTEAIQRLTKELTRQHARFQTAAHADAEATRRDAEARATAVTQARNELESADRSDSLHELDVLTAQFKDDDGAH
jgi:hypothetical protein